MSKSIGTHFPFTSVAMAFAVPLALLKSQASSYRGWPLFPDAVISGPFMRPKGFSIPLLSQGPYSIAFSWVFWLTLHRVLEGYTLVPFCWQSIIIWTAPVRHYWLELYVGTKIKESLSEEGDHISVSRAGNSGHEVPYWMAMWVQLGTSVSNNYKNMFALFMMEFWKIIQMYRLKGIY